MKVIPLANHWTVCVRKNHRMMGYYDLEAYASGQEGHPDGRRYGWGDTDRYQVTEATDGLLARLVEVSLAEPPDREGDA